jgi:uncharacterized cupin superfamily protein
VVEEARLELRRAGKEPVTEGWFVVDVREAAWATNDAFCAVCYFEGDDGPFGQVGYSLAVLEPGKPSGLYHREENQEDFLVLAGECILLVEGEERRLTAWDFVHCPPGTEHILVGAGDGPCVVFMTGARRAPGEIVYPRSELALRHGAGVEEETGTPKEAYAPWPRWRPGPPASFAGLPWG